MAAGLLDSTYKKIKIELEAKMLSLNNLNKSFSNHVAVKNVSFDVEVGQVFGFLGTNGSGKTTTIRMILNIIQSDSGSVSWKGVDIRKVKSGTFGYLPEERGLYPKMKIEEQLLYLASLRCNIDEKHIKKNIHHWLDRFKLFEYRDQTVDKLSKGNQQKIQFIAAVAHSPEIIILDEPFSGLDPVNASLLKDCIGELHSSGKTILFSSHRLDQVERLCTNVGLIHNSTMELLGTLHEVRSATNQRVVTLRMDGCHGFLEQLPGVSIQDKEGDLSDIRISEHVNPQHILERAIKIGEVSLFEVKQPSLEEVYMKLVGTI